MEEYHQPSTEAEKILISKVLRIPKHLWKFSTNGSANHFYFISQAFRYGLYISRGMLTKLRINPLISSDALLEVEPTDELIAFSNQLMEELQKQKDQDTRNTIKKIDDDLNKIIDII